MVQRFSCINDSVATDSCCGSGAFLVRAMTDVMDDCDTEEERDEVKKNQIFGIEYEEGAFGLPSTNMLIHGDGNSNVIQDSMFKRAKWIADNNINIVLMNPPYNATKKCCDPEYTKGWNSKKKEDPSKGLHFVEWVFLQVGTIIQKVLYIMIVGRNFYCIVFLKQVWETV